MKIKDKLLKDKIESLKDFDIIRYGLKATNANSFYNSCKTRLFISILFMIYFLIRTSTLDSYGLINGASINLIGFLVVTCFFAFEISLLYHNKKLLQEDIDNFIIEKTEVKK